MTLGSGSGGESARPSASLFEALHGPPLVIAHERGPPEEHDCSCRSRWKPLEDDDCSPPGTAPEVSSASIHHILDARGSPGHLSFFSADLAVCSGGVFPLFRSTHGWFDPGGSLARCVTIEPTFSTAVIPAFSQTRTFVRAPALAGTVSPGEPYVAMTLGSGSGGESARPSASLFEALHGSPAVIAHVSAAPEGHDCSWPPSMGTFGDDDCSSSRTAP